MNSLDEDLIRDEETKDFILAIHDGTDTINLIVHRIVLTVSSPFLRRRIKQAYRAGYLLPVPRGCIDATVSIVRYFYTRNMEDIEDVEKSMFIASALECGTLYSKLRCMKENVEERDHELESHEESDEDVNNDEEFVVYEPPTTRSQSRYRKQPRRSSRLRRVTTTTTTSHYH